MATRKIALPEVSSLLRQLETRNDEGTDALLAELRAIDRLLAIARAKSPQLLSEAGLIGTARVVGSSGAACACCKRPF